MKESLYILYRRLKALRARARFLLCGIFPIDERLVSVCAFEGKGGFGCNPKYLVRKLHERNPGLRFVWLVDDMGKEFPGYIKKVPNTPWSRAYWLSRSKVWIDNYRKPYGTRKRRGQYYLNVNHYTVGIKCTGLLRGSGFSKMALLVSRSDSGMVDALVIDSAWCEDVSPKGFVYGGPLLKTGAPRCDILHGAREAERARLRARHGLPPEAKVVLFAPTFREGAKDGRRSVFGGEWTLDFAHLLGALGARFGGEWHVCTRVHPQLAPSFVGRSSPAVRGRTFDESGADDMYEILAGVDAYVTDYSSASFEAAFARIPVFLYADDVDRYARERGSLMWDMAGGDRRRVGNNKAMTGRFDVELPFPLARDNGELERDVADFDWARYNGRVDEFCEKLGLVFDGRASERLVEIVERKMNVAPRASSREETL